MLRKANVLSSEMESDTLFVVSSVRGIRAGAIFSAIGSVEGMVVSDVVGIDVAIQVAINAIRLLIEHDRKAVAGQRKLTLNGPYPAV